MEKAVSDSANGWTLDRVRESLIRQEDAIIFSLIERAKFPINSAAYDESFAQTPGFVGSLVQYLVRETEDLHAKVALPFPQILLTLVKARFDPRSLDNYLETLLLGRYENPEEHPFFPDNLSPSLVPPYNYPKFLHPAADSININNTIWDMYFNQLLPLFTVEGDDGHYASTAACDLECLQALSRRIHYGKFVAEVKFTDAPQDYDPAIRAQDTDALMKLLTFESVEEMVKKRVEKKAVLFGQEVSLADDDHKGKYKVDPSVVSRLYGEWVMPLTKLVQVEYLLRRLD